jgi:hypothetical protein
MGRIRICGVAFALTVLAITTVAAAQPTGVVTSNRNPLQIALKHWYAVNSTTSFAVGLDPTAMRLQGNLTDADGQQGAKISGFHRVSWFSWKQLGRPKGSR